MKIEVKKIASACTICVHAIRYLAALATVFFYCLNLPVEPLETLYTPH